MSILSLSFLKKQLFKLDLIELALVLRHSFESHKALILSWLEPGLDFFPAVAQKVTSGKQSKHNMARSIFKVDCVIAVARPASKNK